MSYKLYFINYKDDARKNRMINRFNKIGIHFNIVNGVGREDERVAYYEKMTGHIGVATGMFAHLDIMKKFIEDGNDKDGPFYCIACEDDIYIRKTFKEDIEKVIKDFDYMKLDILLLGYLLNRKIHHDIDFPSMSYTYHHYNDDLWGAQMYMVSRKHAKYFLEKYILEWAINNKDKNFNSDWVVTKDGFRALIWPMLAVEEGENKSGHYGQINFHRDCSIVNYDPDLYY